MLILNIDKLYQFFKQQYVEPILTSELLKYLQTVYPGYHTLTIDDNHDLINSDVQYVINWTHNDQKYSVTETEIRRRIEAYDKQDVYNEI